MSHEHLGREFTAPVKKSLIYTSMVVAVLLNLLPLNQTLLILRPDFVALILFYWNIYQPQQVGMGTAFVMGLIMDVADVSIMGQHALAYCLIAFFALVLHRRLRLFSAFQQIPAVLWFLLLAQVLIYLIGMLTGTYSPEWHFFLASLISAFCWPLIVFVLDNFCQQQAESDEI